LRKDDRFGGFGENRTIGQSRIKEMRMAITYKRSMMDKKLHNTPLETLFVIPHLRYKMAFCRQYSFVSEMAYHMSQWVEKIHPDVRHPAFVK
jgi:hypothetical protein